MKTPNRHDINPATDGGRPLDADQRLIFRPLEFRRLKIKNRLLRSSISGMFDHYDGHGTDARLNWEESFAQGGVGAIISSFVPVTIRGRILTRYATIDSDDKIPFWKSVADRVHRHDCKYILQLSHSGRQQDVGGVENVYKKAQSSTDRKDFFHGILCEAMTKDDIHRTVEQFANGAWRAQQAGLDGVELHGANGYLLTQFLSSAINDRKDEYGGDVAGRTRIVLEIVRAIRQRCGRDFHLQMKINGVDHNSWLYPWEGRGNTLEESVQICKLLEDNGQGVDAFHVSSGSTFPHPRNPPGEFPVAEAVRWYDGMLSSGVRTRFNYAIFTNPVLGPLFQRFWRFRRGGLIEGINVAYSKYVREHVSVPVMVTGGFQHADKIASAMREGACDAVTIARPLIANRSLPMLLKTANGPERPCTYCNKCLLNDLENPLGCYEISRYDGATFDERYERMMKDVMAVFQPAPQTLDSERPPREAPFARGPELVRAPEARP
jgi:2,4-dienoyl-CoA reductase-like NADH-dependent reductase (Old Yellow Enzyme family)